MRRTVLMGLMAGLVIAVTLGFPQAGGAQETSKDQHASDASKQQKSVYRLEFTVREVEEGKRLNSRTYVMSVQDGSTGMIRVGNRIPFATGSFSSGKLETNTQYQYYDVGINIDCHLHEHENYVLLENAGVEISSVVKDESATAGALNPVVRQARARVDAAVTPGKPTLVASLDDVSSNRRYEVEVTATKVK